MPDIGAPTWPEMASSVMDSSEPATVRPMPDTALRNKGRDAAQDFPLPLFLRFFMIVLGHVFEEGYDLVRHVASLLDLSIKKLVDFFAMCDDRCAIELRGVIS